MKDPQHVSVGNLGVYDGNNPPLMKALKSIYLVRVIATDEGKDICISCRAPPTKSELP